jgi:hypothetical protein
MRRFLFAVAALLLVASSPAYAGYIIIRLLLEGGGQAPAGSGTVPGMPMGPGPGGPPPVGRPGFGSPMGPGPVEPMGQPAAAPVVGDHTKSVVVVVPHELAILQESRLDLKGPQDDSNPKFKKLAAPYYGRTLKTSLFVDSSTIQLYDDLIGKPQPKVTRVTEMRDRYNLWTRNKDGQALYDALILCLESGLIREAPTKDLASPPDAVKIAQELVDAAANPDPKRPLPDVATRFAKVWAEVSKGMRQAPGQQPEALRWQSILTDSAATNVRTDRFYSIVYWDSPEAEVKRRGEQLNDHMTAFYLLHAVRGVALPVPAKPFMVVLARDAVHYTTRLRPSLDGLPSQADALYSSEHDIVVLSPEMMDANGPTFHQQLKQYFRGGLSRDQLLNGQLPKIDATGAHGLRPEEVARSNTLAFIEKLAMNDTEIAAVSREGTRQLLYATGGLPRHVTLPNWLTQGALNFYTRPRGPAYVSVGEDEKQKDYMTVALSTGYGVPNYVHQRYFRDLDTHKELNADRAKLLEHVLTDAYFTGLKDGLDPDPAPPAKKKAKPAGAAGANPMGGPGGAGLPSGDPDARPGGFGPMGPAPAAAVSGADEDPIALQKRKKARLEIKSQATAWALYYYLARSPKRADGLAQYLAELNKLPRDLPIDGKTSYAAFVRAFKLGSEEGVPNPALMQEFARDWMEYISTVPMVGFDIPLVAPTAVPAGMGMGMGPGGMPMPPGGRGGP